MARPTITDVQRRVLLVAHTPLSARYVNSHYEVMRGDPRLAFAATQAPDDFGAGVGQVMRGMGVPILPLERAATMEWDMSLCGTHYLPDVITRVKKSVLIQHGLGGGKVVNGEDYSYGPRLALRSDGRPRYDLMLEASEATRRRAVAGCPELEGVIRVVGDMACDHLLAHGDPGMREACRRELGIEPEQTAVLAISSFGPDGLLGRYGRELVPRLLALPEAYKPLITAHPHIWARPDRTPGAVELLTDARAQGMPVCQPGEDWVRYLAAADGAIIDHSSMSLYYSLMARPTIAVPVQGHLINPGAPVDMLRRASPVLASPGDLDPEFIDGVVEGFDPATFAERRATITSHPGEAIDRTRAVLYEGLGLSPPALPAVWRSGESPSPSRHTSEVEVPHILG